MCWKCVCMSRLFLPLSLSICVCARLLQCINDRARTETEVHTDFSHASGTTTILHRSKWIDNRLENLLLCIRTKMRNYLISLLLPKRKKTTTNLQIKTKWSHIKRCAAHNTFPDARRKNKCKTYILSWTFIEDIFSKFNSLQNTFHVQSGYKTIPPIWHTNKNSILKKTQKKAAKP